MPARVRGARLQGGSLPICVLSSCCLVGDDAWGWGAARGERRTERGMCCHCNSCGCRRGSCGGWQVSSWPSLHCLESYPLFPLPSPQFRLLAPHSWTLRVLLSAPSTAPATVLQLAPPWADLSDRFKMRFLSLFYSLSVRLGTRVRLHSCLETSQHPTPPPHCALPARLAFLLFLEHTTLPTCQGFSTCCHLHRNSHSSSYFCLFQSIFQHRLVKWKRLLHFLLLPFGTLVCFVHDCNCAWCLQACRTLGVNECSQPPEATRPGIAVAWAPCWALTAVLLVTRHTRSHQEQT